MSWWKYVGMSWVTMGSIALTNWASQNLNYATVVLFKSSKLAPVVVLNVLLLGKVPKGIELWASVATIMGLCLFSLGDVKGHNKFTWAGLVAILVSLGIGASGANLEEKILQELRVPQQELVAFMYGCSMIQTGLLAMLVENQFWSATTKLWNDSGAILPLFLFSFFGCIGIQFVYLMIKCFGSLTTTMVTSVRKALTVCLSFVIFRDKEFTVWHGLGATLMALGMGLNTADKTRSREAREAGRPRPNAGWSRPPLEPDSVGVDPDFGDATPE